MNRLLLFFACSCLLKAQTVCPPTPAFGICDITFPGMPANETLKGEFRSPDHRTYLIPGFWDGKQMVIRVSPTDPGQWNFRFSDGKEGSFTATASESPGLVEVANVHHFWYSATHKAHLWMGDTVPQLDRGAFERYVDVRAGQHFTHLRVLLIPGTTRPDDAWFQDLDQRLLYINRKGIVADLFIARSPEIIAKLFPAVAQRESFIRYLVARYGAMNITWQGFEEFELYEGGRELLKEIGGSIARMDQYRHLTSTGAQITSSPLFDDGWMKYLTCRSADGDIPSVEHQIYASPGVVDFSANDNRFRQRLWNSTMSGAYPEAVVSDEASAQQMKVWFDIMADTRHWELEPFFDVEGGKGLALEGIEYLIYVEKPGLVKVTVEKRSYDLEWINPITGESIALKNLKQETFEGSPPDTSHDWILHISREGSKKSMAKSYRFESRDVLMQEIESNPDKVPFDIAQPSADSISLANPGPFAVKIKKDTRATRTARYVWTGEVTTDGQSFRVVGTGANGNLQIPSNLAFRFPALLHLRLVAMNAYGKVFVVDRNIQLTK
jgi:Protein of unknown function (DUF4038)/Domain of unknown function (DUF5060)